MISCIHMSVSMFIYINCMQFFKTSYIPLHLHTIIHPFCYAIQRIRRDGKGDAVLCTHIYTWVRNVGKVDAVLMYIHTCVCMSHRGTEGGALCLYIVHVIQRIGRVGKINAISKSCASYPSCGRGK